MFCVGSCATTLGTTSTLCRTSQTSRTRSAHQPPGRRGPPPCDSSSPCPPSPSQIIVRARQEHLLRELTASTSSLTPELITQTREAWTFFFRKNIVKFLAPADVPAEGQDESAWDDALVGKWEKEQAWRSELEAKEEKFSMYWKTLVSQLSALVRRQRVCGELMSHFDLVLSDYRPSFDQVG